MEGTQPAPAAPMSMPPAPRKERPIGVVVIAVFMIIGGILWLIAGGLLAAAFLAVDVVLGALCSLNLVLGILQIVLAIGLLGLRKWAWIGTVVIVIISLLLTFGIIALLMGLAATVGGVGFAGLVGGLLLAGAAIPIVIDVIILVYLFTARVRAAFD